MKRLLLLAILVLAGCSSERCLSIRGGGEDGTVCGSPAAIDALIEMLAE